MYKTIEELKKRTLIFDCTSLKILFLSEYDPRYIGIWYKLPLCYVLAIRYCLSPRGRYDELCYKIVTGKHEGIKNTKVVKLLICPFKSVKSVYKATIQYSEVHDAIILKINEHQERD